MNGMGFLVLFLQNFCLHFFSPSSADDFSDQFWPTKQSKPLLLSIYKFIFLFVWSFLKKSKWIHWFPQKAFLWCVLHSQFNEGFLQQCCIESLWHNTLCGVWQWNQETLHFLGFVWNCSSCTWPRQDLRRAALTLQHRPMFWVLFLPLHSKSVLWRILQACCRGTEQLCVHRQQVCLLWECVGVPLPCVFEVCGVFICLHLHGLQSLCQTPKAAILSEQKNSAHFLQSALKVETLP